MERICNGVKGERVYPSAVLRAAELRAVLRLSAQSFPPSETTVGQQPNYRAQQRQQLSECGGGKGGKRRTERKSEAKRS